MAALRLTIFFVFETLAHQKPFGLSLSKPYGKSHSTFCGEDVFLEVRTPFSVRAEPVEASRLAPAPCHLRDGLIWNLAAHLQHDFYNPSF